MLSSLYAGSFHLIHLMFDDYVLYLLESLHCQERANDLMRAMKSEGSTGEIATWRPNQEILGNIQQLPTDICFKHSVLAQEL